METIYSRNCPKCDKELTYSNKYHLKEAIDKNRICITCSCKEKAEKRITAEILERNCPNCNTVIKYESKHVCRRAEDKGFLCQSCAASKRNKLKKKKVDYNKYERDCYVCGAKIIYKNKHTYGKEKQVRCMSCAKTRIVIKTDEIGEYSRICPLCCEKIVYAGKYGYLLAVKNNSKCKSCCRMLDEFPLLDELKRICGNCNSEIIHKSVQNFRDSLLNDKKCKNCSHRGEFWMPPEKRNTACIECGKNKLHITLQSYMRASEKGYLCNSCSKKGARSNSFGKPTSPKSGYGWCGWYKNIIFRSLYELEYMVNNLKDRQWVSAESLEFMIPYINKDGIKRNYFPDFFVDGKYLIEIKPEHKMNDPDVLAKKNAAEQWCFDRNFEYIMIDCGPINKKQLIELYNSGEIKFSDKYDKKYKKENNIND